MSEYLRLVDNGPDEYLNPIINMINVFYLNDRQELFYDSYLEKNYVVSIWEVDPEIFKNSKIEILYEGEDKYTADIMFKLYSSASNS